MNARRFLTLIIYLCDFVIYIYSKPTESNTISTEHGLDFRIIGGKPTSIADYPFVVSVQRRYDRHLCGGSYILPKFILSAAHCMVSLKGGRLKSINPRLLVVVAGSTGVKYLHGSKMQIRLINRVFPHPLYNPINMHHDIGLYQAVPGLIDLHLLSRFKLVEPFKITRFVYPSPIPNSIDNTLARTKFPICTVVGWGRLKTGSNTGYGDILRQVQVPLITTEKCRHQVQLRVNKESQICAGVDEGGLDSCQGDSGGPMLCDNIQVGIVSWGMGCGEKYSPGIYSRVDYYLDWINDTVTRNISPIDYDPCLLIHYLFITFLIYFF